MQNSPYIEEYFTSSAWKLLSEYEKRRLENLKTNYELLKSTGITPRIPDFMKNNVPQKRKIQSKKAELEGENIQKTKLKLFAVPKKPFQKKETFKPDERLHISKKYPRTSTDSDKHPFPSFRTCTSRQFSEIMLGSLKTLLKHFENSTLPKDLKLPHENIAGSDSNKRYPKRSIERKIYTEEDISSDDEFLHCDDCDKEYKGACPIHGPMIHVCDTKVAKGDPNRAQKTLPKFLSVSRSIIPKAGLGIWAEMFLPKGTVFGPYEGTKRDKQKEVKDSGYAWQVRKRYSRHYVEGADKSLSNWMRYVNCAAVEQRQNVVAFQFRKGVYYRTYKDVLPHTELLVWYGDGYASDLGIDLRESKVPEQQKEVGGYRCDVCSALFSSSSALEGHRKTHPHMQHDRTHKCPHCPYSTVRQGDLRRHLLTHSGEKPHTCIHCHKLFTHKYHLQTHLRAHAGEKPYSCDACGRGFNQLSNLRRHERTHTGERHHRCPTCGKDFTEAGNLKTHVRTHTLQRPYRCPHCDYRATVSSALREHIVYMHTHDFKHKCSVCGKGFVTPSRLKKHEETHSAS